MTTTILHRDCVHFVGDRPCKPHKDTGVKCGECPYYQAVQTKVLIIKLDALGDVLRTTCILDALHNKYPGVAIDWLTRPNAAPLFTGNPLVHKVIEFPDHAWSNLLATQYDLTINLDPSPVSGQLCSIARSNEKLGFTCDQLGRAEPLNPEAQDWFEMGLFDDLKLSNTKTYQEIALEICRLPGDERSLHLYLSESEQQKALATLNGLGIDAQQTVVGLNTGASDRWPHKKWTIDGYVGLIKKLVADTRLPSRPSILLLGGPAEAERNAAIAERCPQLSVNAGSDHSLREFFALIDCCDLLVTGDTLALHVAAARNKAIVALFGPTSASEIDLYGKGIKLSSDAPCVGRYLTDCDVSPTCMERITPQQVNDAVIALLSNNNEGPDSLQS